MCWYPVGVGGGGGGSGGSGGGGGGGDGRGGGGGGSPPVPTLGGGRFSFPPWLVLWGELGRGCTCPSSWGLPVPSYSGFRVIKPAY